MNELEALDITQIFDIARSIGIPVGDYDSQSGNFIGCSNVEAPVQEPDFPDRISTVGDHELGDLLHEQSEWAGHLEERLAEYTAQLRIYKELKDRIERKLLLTSEQGKVTSKKAEARTSPEFIEANGKIALFEAIVDLIQAAINKANRRYTNLSRQISLRGQDFDRTQRNNNASYGNPTNISGSRGKVRRMP
mgnify:FL=1